VDGVDSTAGFSSIYRDFVKMFPDDAGCAAYLERLRWSHGFACPVANNVNRGEPREPGWFVPPADTHVPLPPERFLIKPERP